MKKPVRLSFLIFNFTFLISLSSCSDNKDDAPYPAIITEMADCPTDAEGTMTKLILDDNTELPVTNVQTGLKKNVIYRCLAGYTLEDGRATLYSLKGCPLLFDSTAVANVCDPVAVVSLWRTPRYINLHLMPKTQDQGQHTWGFITDSIVARHAYLRLHHRQGDDPTSYSTDVYASLPMDSIEADTVTLHIATFTGTREWTL